MKIVLGRKQKYNSDEPWRDAVAHIGELITPEEVEEYAEKTVARISAGTAG